MSKTRKPKTVAKVRPAQDTGMAFQLAKLSAAADPLLEQMQLLKDKEMDAETGNAITKTAVAYLGFQRLAFQMQTTAIRHPTGRVKVLPASDVKAVPTDCVAARVQDLEAELARLKKSA